MGKLPINTDSHIAISETDFAEVIAAYTTPLTEDDKTDFVFKDCIVVLFALQGNYERKYLYCQYFDEFNFEKFNEIPQAKDNLGIFIAKHSHPRVSAELIREKHSI